MRRKEFHSSLFYGYFQTLFLIASLWVLFVALICLIIWNLLILSASLPCFSLVILPNVIFNLTIKQNF